MNIQTFAEQIAVVQARHHEREKELLKLLREGLEVTKRADGHWNDYVRWENWVDKVEKELD